MFKLLNCYSKECKDGDEENVQCGKAIDQHQIGEQSRYIYATIRNRTWSEILSRVEEKRDK